MKTEIRPRDVLIDLLSIPSVTRSGGEIQISSYLSKLFEDYGIEHETVTVNGQQDLLLATILGKERSAVVFNGHSDTVPFNDPGLWRTPPDKPVIEDGAVYCRGASDMKSGLAAAVAAFINRSLSDKQPGKTLKLLVTCDEEMQGRGAEAAVERNLIADAGLIIVPEPTDNRICLVEKGCVWLELEFQGKSCHSAYPMNGINAFDIGCDVIASLRRLLESSDGKGYPDSTLVVTKAAAGIANNILPDKARFAVDIRTNPLMNSRLIEERLYQEKAKWERMGCGFTYEMINDRNPLASDKSDPMVQEFIKTAGDEMYTDINYYTDLSLLDPDSSIPFVIFGPGPISQMHKVNEYCKLADFDSAYQVFLDYIFRI